MGEFTLELEETPELVEEKPVKGHFKNCYVCGNGWSNYDQPFLIYGKNYAISVHQFCRRRGNNL